MKKQLLYYLAMFLSSSLGAQTLMFEDFSSGSLPAGWTQSSVSSGDSWEFGTAVDFGPSSPIIPDASGNIGEYANIDFSDDPDTTALITPKFSIAGVLNPELTFEYITQTTATLSPYNQLIVDYWNGSSWSNITVIDTLTTQGWTSYTFNISAFTFNTDSVQFRFAAQEGGTAVGGTGTLTYDQDLALDEVRIGAAPTCFVPTLLTATGISTSSASFGWTPGGTETLWEVEFVPAGDPLGSGIRDTTSSNPVTLSSGLVSGYTYDFYVRGICTAGDSSAWGGPTSATISCNPFAGTYTLGSSGDFTSFTDLSTRLNNCGISANVTINVLPGTYSERLTLGSITGSSATNTITINGGDTGLVTITNGALATIDLAGTDYMTIKNMTIVNTGTSDAYGIRFSDSAEYNVIDSNRIICNTTATGSDIAAILASNSPNSFTDGQNGFYNTINNNHIIGGYYGVRLQGQLNQRNIGNTIDNNFFQDQYFYGLFIDDQDSLTITNNTFENLGRGQTTGADGMDLNDIMMFTITGNTLLNVPDLGIAFDDGNIETNATPTSRGLIANNIITSASDNCMQLDDVVETDIWYNTLYNESTANGAIQLDNIDSVTIQNNIFVSTGDYALESDDALSQDSSNSIIDNNLYWTPSSNTKFVDDGPTIHTDLASWQAALVTENINSIETDPVFTSVTTGDFTPISFNADNAGVPLGINVDINGNPRSTTTPDVGAIEFTSVAPTCLVPTLLTATSPSNSTANLAWTPGGTETLWEIEYVFAGDTLGSGTRDTTSANPATLSGLVSGYTYDFYVRGICSVGDSSAWTGPVTLTISCSPFAGTYTLGASSGDFTSFTDLSTRLTNCGISASITVNVLPGTYSERLTLGSIAGSSATNTITINGGDTSLVTLTNDSLATVDLVGTDYLTIKNITIENTGTFDAYGIRFSDSAEYNVIDSNRIMCNTTATGSDITAVVASASPTTNSTDGQNSFHNTVSNNHIIGGYHGVRLQGQLNQRNIGNTINNNLFQDQYLYGLFIDDQDSLTITNNTFENLGRGQTTGADGMDLNDIMMFTITGNTLLNVPDLGIAFDDGNIETNATPTSRGLIANNIITSASDNCMQLDDVVETDIWYNTLYNESTANGAIQLDNIDSVTIQNNIFVSTGDYALESDDALSQDSSNSIIDNNLYWTPLSNTKFVDDGPTIHTDLASWQAALVTENINSIETNPVFASVTNGDFTPISFNADNAGVPLGINVDINGNPRSTTTPDVGAIEFIGLPADLAIASASLNQVDLCYGTADTAFATINNLFGSAVDFASNSLKVYWQVTGPVNTIDSLTISTGTLAVGSDTTVAIATIDMSIPGTYLVSAYIAPNAVNGSSANDTIMGTSETVQELLSVANDSLLVTNNYDVAGLIASSPLFPTPPMILTEICHFRTATSGDPVNGWPSYLTAGEYIEITSVPGFDIGGTILEIWNTTGLQKSGIIPAGSIVGPNGTAVIAFGETGSSVPSPADFYYHLSDMSGNLQSGDEMGYALKTPQGQLIDAAGYPGNLGSYDFPAASGVTTADWSGSLNAVNSTAGIRLEGADVNDTTNWKRSAVSPQDPNTLNAGVTVPAAPPVAGFDWSLSSTVVSNSPTYDAGPYSADGVFEFVANFTNACGTFTDTTVVTVSLLNTSVVSTDITCNGDSNGTATVTASGSVMPYTFAWSNGDMGTMADSLAAGTYYVTIYDANGDSIIDSAAIAEPAMLDGIATLDSNATICSPGGATGSATGGTMPYTYAWSGGIASSSNLIAGQGLYTLSVTDANGCVATDTVSISGPASSFVAAAVVDSAVSCNGLSDGGASAVALGGALPYSYQWNTGATTASITGLIADVYTVTISDGGGCVIVDTVTLTEPMVLVANSTLDNSVSCFGLADGGATVSVAGGTSPYMYMWSNTATTASITGVAAGTYSVTITDNNGCTDSSTVTITEPTLLVATSMLDSNASCNGFLDGGATASATGGTGAYTYAWSNMATTASITGVAAGTYSVTITDNNGCTDSSAVTIAQSALVVAASVVDSNISCNGFSDGGATASATGGTGAYTYSWNNTATTASITGVVAGTYSVTITDNNGCTDSSAVTITEPVLLVAASSVDSNISCNGLIDGGATASAIGGTGAYTYSWNNSATTVSITGVAAGTYSVTITDNNGCTDSSAVTITEPVLLVAASSVDSNISCNGLIDGGATASAIGGTGAYTYSWNNSATTVSITGVAAGTYSVTITDANGCTDSSSVMITEPTALVVTTVVDSNVTCNGGSDGGATSSATGGTMPYAYAWSNSATTASITSVGAGTYTVTITDANGCTATSSATITEPAAIAVTFYQQDVDCFGDATGEASAVGGITGGTAPYSYTWSTGSSADTITGLIADDYTITISDANGCTSSATVTISQNDSIEIDLDVTNTTCEGGDNGSITTTVTGGVAAYTYAWSNAETTANISNLMTGPYDVTITDMLGCQSSATGTVDFDNPLPVVDLGADTAVGPINTVTLNSGYPNDDNLWSSGATTSSLDVVVTADTTVWVTVTTSAGCVGSDTIVIGALLSANGVTKEVDMKLFPNPTNGQVYLEIQDLNANEVSVQILDYSGKLVMERNWDYPSNFFRQQFDLSNQSQGMYFVNILIDGHRHTEYITIY